MTFGDICGHVADVLGVIFLAVGIGGIISMRRVYIRSGRKMKPWLTDAETLKSRGVTPNWFTKWSVEALQCFLWLMFGLIRLLNFLENVSK